MPSTDLAIQSWCLRGRDALADVIDDLTASGVTAVELCRKHCDFDDPDAVAAAAAQLREDVVIGRSGNLDLGELMAAVASCPTEPCQIIEYEGDAPVPALAACVDAWTGVVA